jgi:hypothetical protein
MKDNSPPLLYKKYHIDKEDERLDIFRILAEKFKIKTALYPGSYVHITPSLVIPKVVYVDDYKKTKQFYNNPALYEFIFQKKQYKEEAEIGFHFKDYRKNIDEPKESFDLLISQYAGFISQYCKKYLKAGGLLVANNSHGDASMASIDKDYEFTGVFNKRRGSKYAFSDKNLNTYFIPKKPRKITKVYLKQIQKGIGYTKYASSYLFRKVE